MVCDMVIIGVRRRDEVGTDRKTRTRLAVFACCSYEGSIGSTIFVSLGNGETHLVDVLP